MLVVKSGNIRDNFKEWCEKVSKGETIVISRPKNENVYMISEEEYNKLQKAKENEEYLEVINRRIERLNNGEGIHKTMEELRAMENE